jgi:hypothetical protein
MRFLVAALALAALAAGCAAPPPTAIPSPPATPLTAKPTATPTPLPTMAAFGDPYTGPEGGSSDWSVVASWDGSASPERVVSTGQAKSGTIVEVVFACEHATQITIQATDAQTGDLVGNMSAPCSPGNIGGGTFGSTGRKMSVALDASADPAVRFWVKIAVPTDHYLPR